MVGFAHSGLQNKRINAERPHFVMFTFVLYALFAGALQNTAAVKTELNCP